MNSNKLHVLLGGPMLAVLVVTVLMLTNGSHAAILGTVGSCNVYDEPTYEGNNGAQITIAGNTEFTYSNGSTGCAATGSKTNEVKIRCTTNYNPYDITSGPNAGQVVCAKAGTAGAKEGTEWTWGTIASQSTTPSTSTTGSITPSTTTTTPSTTTTTPSTTTTTPSTTTTTPSTTTTTPTTTTTTAKKPACTTNDWSCVDWGACSATGIQKRTCTLSTACSGYVKKPATFQKCTPPATTTQTTTPTQETAKPAAVEQITQAAQDKTTQPTTQQQTDQDQQPQQETPPVVEEPSEDTTISFKDTENEDVIDLVTRMVNLGALKIPKTPKETIFGLKKKTSRSYMLRIALTVKGEKVGCGKNPKTKCIISKAKDAGLIETYKKGSVTKIESYELLLKAAGSGIDEEITGKSPCEDVKADDEIAPIIATAKREGILNKFKYQGKKGYCLPNAAVPKGEAAFTAMQLLRQENE